MIDQKRIYFSKWRGGLLLAIIIGISALSASSFAATPDWESFQTLGRHKLPGHSQLMPYASSSQALKADAIEPFTNSPYYKLLNGQWKFKWSPKPSVRPKDFYTPDFSATSWKKIRVPSSWQAEGFGTPLYTNIKFPFKVDPPRVMGTPPADFTNYTARNPVGSYRRWFRVPKHWSGRHIFLTFNGVDSAFYVWVNGEKVGYSEGSRTPAEFDVTKYLHSGKNLLAVQVYRYSDGSYMEDQDMWRLSGIFRDVYLWSTGNLHVQDLFVRARLDKQYKNGQLQMDVDLKNWGGAKHRGLLTAQLIDPNGKTIERWSTQAKTLAARHSAHWRISHQVNNPAQWTAETPALYTLLLTVKSEQGKTIEVDRTDIGFRDVQINGGRLLVNGKAILIKGVDRHEIDPATGHFVSKADMVKDIMLMKRNNINAVRTSHYPNRPMWYRLCDKYGIYVFDEANVESHGLYNYHYKNSTPTASNPAWLPALMQRERRMFARDKNHPSIIVWSMGNESKNGPNFHKVYHWFHKVDPTRPVHWNPAGTDSDTDILAPMYPTFDEMKKLVRGNPDRPLILCEYAHAMGDASGNLSDYWSLIRSHPRMQGGFIWEFINQALWKRGPTGKKFFAYGGDFGDVPNDGDFSINGFVNPDRTTKPMLAQVKKTYQNIHVKDLKSGRFQIYNENFFTNLNRYTLRWQLEQDGHVVKTGVVGQVDVAPGERKTISIPALAAALKSQQHQEVITLSFHEAHKTPWARKGYEVAWDQFVVPGSKASWLTTLRSHGTTTINKVKSGYSISGAHFTLNVNAANGAITRYSYAGHDLLTGPIAPNFWRVPNDNQYVNKFVKRLGAWKDAAAKAKVVALHVSHGKNGTALVDETLALPVGKSRYRVRYTVDGRGVVRMKVNFTPKGENLPDLPRLGIKMNVPAAMHKVTWYGRGPEENYWDRSTGYKFGIYHAPVSKLTYSYIRSQQNGNRTGVRWFKIVDRAGRGLKFEAKQGNPLQFSARPYSMQDLEAAHHPFDLPTRNYVQLLVDDKQMGLGARNTWGAKVLPQYTIPAKAYTYTLTIVPLDQHHDSATAR